MRERVLSDAHREVSSGHLGVEKTYDRVAREYYWPGVWYDVHRYVTSCPECQCYKIVQSAPQGLMGQRVVEHPWSVDAADLMEFPSSKGQYKYIVVFQDLFSRWVELKPLRSADSKNVAQAFEELVIFRWGTPDFFLSDNGKEFLNKVLSEVLKEYGIEHVTTPPYHTQANPVERSNRTLKTMISLFVGKDHKSWDRHLHELRFAINTAIQSSTKVSPAFLNFGRHPAAPKSLRREVEHGESRLRLEPEIWENRLKRLEALRDLVRAHNDSSREKQSKRYNRGRRDVVYQVGDQVMRKVKVLSNAGQGFSAKLAPKYEGPYSISQVLSPTVYLLDTGKNQRIDKIHVSDIKKYVSPRKGV